MTRPQPPTPQEDEEAATIAEHEATADMEVEETAIVLHEDKNYYPDADEVSAELSQTLPRSHDAATVLLFVHPV